MLELISSRSNDEVRIAALRRYAILDTEAEPAFDRCTRLAARLLGMPMAAISFLDTERQWFKSAVGLPVSETSLEGAFCLRAVEHEDAFVVPDALRDERFRTSPLVTGPLGLRFYAGVPLLDRAGHALGTLCVMDRRPRRLGAAKLEILQDLAGMVMNELELRLAKAEAMSAKREALRANAAKSNFFQAMSHELRTPLNAIIGFSQIMADDDSGSLSDPHREYARMIHTAGSSLLDLVRNLLALKQLEQGKYTPRNEDSDLVDAVHEIVESAQPRAATQGVGLVLDSTLSAEGRRIDLSALRRILANLLSNAISVSPAGGHVSVAATDRDGSVLLTVQDTGPGIPAKIFKNLADGTISAADGAEPSYGLALTVAHELAEALGGNLRVERNGPRGTVISACLPCAAEKARSFHPRAPGGAAADGCMAMGARP